VLLVRCGESARVALRPSGTEPKAKAYLEVCTPPRGGASDERWAAMKHVADELMGRLGPEFVRLALARVGL
jgi:phosphomannomutase